jgi:hypothetical protein
VVMLEVKKGKAVPQDTHGGAGEMYSTYSFTNSALDGGEWSASRFGCALLLGKEPPVPIVQEPQSRSGHRG